MESFPWTVETVYTSSPVSLLTMVVLHGLSRSSTRTRGLDMADELGWARVGLGRRCIYR